jgi:ADP-heptose:LPS heptosyltransferase
MYVYKKKQLVILFTIIDAIGRCLSWPFKVFGRKPSSSYGRVAVLRLDHIGDVIMATSVFKPLRRALPASKIDAYIPSWAFDLVKASPEVNSVVVFDPVWFDRKRQGGFFAELKCVLALAAVLKKGKYDAIIDLRGDFRQILAMWLSGARTRISYGITGGGFLLTHEAVHEKGMHEIDRDMRLVSFLGASSSAPAIDLHVSPEAIRKAERALGENDVMGPYAVVHMSPGYSIKCWDTDGFFAVSGYLSGAKDLMCVFVGAPDDSDIVKNVISRLGKKGSDLCGKTDLEALAAIIRNASFFVGVDSAPAHIASAFKVPGVVLFSGVNDPDEWAPRDGSIKTIYPGEGKDLSSVTPQEVCAAIDRMLK